MDNTRLRWQASEDDGIASEMTSWPGEQSDDSDGDGDEVPATAFYSPTPPQAAATKLLAAVALKDTTTLKDTTHLRVDVASAQAAHVDDEGLTPSSPAKHSRVLDLPPPQLKKIMSGDLRIFAGLNLNEGTHLAVEDLPVTAELARAAAEIDKCLQRRNKYMSDEKSARAASLAPGSRLPASHQPPFLPFEPSAISPGGGLVKAQYPARSAHELVFENGVYAVKTPDGRTLEAPMSCSEVRGEG